MVKCRAKKRLDLGFQILRASFFGGWVILINSNLYAANLVANGDFSSGNSGFSSDYVYIATPTCFESQYSVVTRAVDVHSAWTTVIDASGDGPTFNMSPMNSLPLLNSSVPADDAAAVAANANIVLTFSEPVDAKTGHIVLWQSSDDAMVESFSVTGARVSGSGTATITIDPTNDLLPSTGYYITVDTTAFDDAEGASYVGISDKTACNFSTSSTMPDPLEDQDIVAGIESQADISNRFLRHSIYASLNRMEWLRRNRGGDNLTHMDINLKSNDSELNKALDLLPIPKYLNGIVDKSLPAGWSMWTEGIVTTGEVEETNNASEKKITSKSVSLGLDKEISENFILGAVTRVGSDDVDIEDSGSSIDADLYSLSFYGSYMFDGSNYVEGVIGVSRLDFDHTRRLQTGTLSGSRDGEQLYGSVVYRREFKNEPFHISPYGRIDLGYTKLDNYTESGTNAALRYDEQTLGYTLISGGILADYKIQTNFGLLRPHGRIEYGADINDSSDAEMSYVTAPGAMYTLGMDSESSHNWRAGVGLDMDTSFGVSMNAGYERYQQEDRAYSDSFYLSAAYLFKSSTSYNLKLNYGAESMLLGLGIKTRLNDACSISLEYDIEAEELGDWQSNDAIMIKADIKF